MGGTVKNLAIIGNNSSKPRKPETIFNSASQASRERVKEATRFYTKGAIAAAAIS